MHQEQRTEPSPVRRQREGVLRRGAAALRKFTPHRSFHAQRQAEPGDAQQHQVLQEARPRDHMRIQLQPEQGWRQHALLAAGRRLAARLQQLDLVGTCC